MKEHTLKEIPGLINLDHLKSHYTLRADHASKSSLAGAASTAAEIAAGIPVVCHLYDGVPFGQGAAFFARLATGMGTIPKTKNAISTVFQGTKIEDFLADYGENTIRVVEVTLEQAYLLDAQITDLDKPAGKVVSESGGHMNALNLETLIREMEKEKGSVLFKGGTVTRLDSVMLLCLVQAAQIDTYVATLLEADESQRQDLLAVRPTVSAAVKAGKQGDFEVKALLMAEYLTSEALAKAKPDDPHSAVLTIDLSFKLGLSYMKQKADENYTDLFTQDGIGGAFQYKLEELIKRGKPNSLVMWLVYTLQSVDRAQALLYRAGNDPDTALYMAMLELIK